MFVFCYNLKTLVINKSKTYNLWHFFLGIVWSKAYSKIWSDHQCKNLKNIICALAECKRKCEETAGCNVINHDESSNITSLRKCPIPIPRPEWAHQAFQGYQILTGELYVSKYYRFNNRFRN